MRRSHRDSAPAHAVTSRPRRRTSARPAADVRADLGWRSARTLLGWPLRCPDPIYVAFFFVTSARAGRAAGRQSLAAAHRRPRDQPPDNFSRSEVATCSAGRVVHDRVHVVVTVLLIGLGLGLAMLVQTRRAVGRLPATELPGPGASGSQRPRCCYWGISKHSGRSAPHWALRHAARQRARS